MKVITVVVSDGPEPSTAYIGDMSPREAAMACYEAHLALLDEVPEMQVDRTASNDWQVPQ